MNNYTAIMKAADLIEKNPQMFSFQALCVPVNDCGSPGCALGWIGFFKGQSGFVGEIARSLGIEEPRFYDRMHAISHRPTDHSRTWVNSAAICATTLRVYADKYHGHERSRPVSALVKDLMTKVMGEKIPEDA